VERDAFLQLVAARLGGAPEEPLPAMLPSTPASGDGRLFERFAEELQKAGGVARRVDRGRLAAAVAEAATGMGARSAVVATDVEPWRDAVDDGLAGAACRASRVERDSAAGADLGITSAVCGVASTGSVLLRGSARSPRIASLLPRAHLVLLSESTLLPGFEELFERLGDEMVGAAGAVLVTGPSRTADIELNVVRGVHGPGAVTVLVVPDAARPAGSQVT